MADWAPVLVGVVLFILLSPGLLFQLPGNGRHVEFGGFKTNGKAIFVHTIIFFGVFTILILAVGIHIQTGMLGLVYYYWMLIKIIIMHTLIGGQGCLT